MTQTRSSLLKQPTCIYPFHLRFRRRYKKIVNVYLDERWHHERKAEFYRKLENQQGKRLVERRKENRSRENAMIVGMEK